jgi:cyclopropane fatty-acyl-phospholipid synthase-like methyltransferase
MGKYNCTQLNPDQAFNRSIYHRDQFAHFLRWTHVLKRLKIGMNILDWGSGSGNLLEVIYRNRFKSNKYLGLEYRKETVEKNNEKYKNLDWAEFKQQDLLLDFNYGNDWNIICSFEVIEHIGKQNVNLFLSNLYKHCNNETIILLSTPCYDEKVGAADNHIINGEIGELTYSEMKESLINNNFIIKNTWGTFASQKDYKDLMNDWQVKMYNKLSEYYDSNLIANIMAPFFPEHSRNVLWECQIKNNKTLF